jgi:anti-sigma regulatory factor (Ser/Thr protein kinase)
VPGRTLRQGDAPRRVAETRVEVGGVAGSGPLEARLTLRPVPASAGLARRFVAATLSGWGRDDVTDDVTLLVSELVTNAMLHARSDIALVVVVERGRLRVEVQDGSPTPPTPRVATSDAMTGRGMALVETLSADWGVRRTTGGKGVWFTLLLP